MNFSRERGFRISANFGIMRLPTRILRASRSPYSIRNQFFNVNLLVRLPVRSPFGLCIRPQRLVEKSSLAGACLAAADTADAAADQLERQQSAALSCFSRHESQPAVIRTYLFFRPATRSLPKANRFRHGSSTPTPSASFVSLKNSCPDNVFWPLKRYFIFYFARSNRGGLFPLYILFYYSALADFTENNGCLAVTSVIL